ncbi:MAG: hypothetical protein ACI8ZO_001225 [Flavobacteriales bacterium]|jgi:hypothetical protein
MKMILHVFFLTSLFLVSCNKDDEMKKDIPERSATVTDVILPESAKAGESFELTIKYEVSGCETLKMVNTSMNDSSATYHLIIHNPSANDPSVNCPMGFFEENYIESLAFNQIGVKRIYFNDSSLVKTIEIQ